MVHLATETDILQDFIGQATPVVDEARIHVEEDCIWMKGVGPANVAMVDTSLSADAFETFDGGDLVLGVNISRLEDVINMAERTSTTGLRTEDGHTLTVTADGVEFSLACIDTESIRQEPDIPELELPNSFRVGWEHVEQAVKAGMMVSDHTSIICDPEGAVLFEAEGDTDDVVKQLVNEPESIDITEDTASIYSLDFMDSLNRGVPGADTVVSVHQGHQFPLIVEFEFGNGNGDCTYIVAPRIEN